QIILFNEQVLFVCSRFVDVHTPLEKVSTFRPCRYLVEDPSAQSVRNQAATYETLLIRTFFRRSPTLVCSSTCVALSTRQDTNHMRDRIDHHPPILAG